MGDEWTRGLDYDAQLEGWADALLVCHSGLAEFMREAALTEAECVGVGGPGAGIRRGRPAPPTVAEARREYEGLLGWMADRFTAE